MLSLPLKIPGTQLFRFHIMAVCIFIAMAVLTLRTILFGDSLFIYRDTFPLDPSRYLYDAISVFDLEATRRISYLGPYFAIGSFLEMSVLTMQKTSLLISHFLVGFLGYVGSYKFLSSQINTEQNRKLVFLLSILFGFFYLYNARAAEGLTLTGFGFAFSYSLIPLIFYYYNRSLNEKTFSNIVIVSILISLSVAASIQFLAWLPLFVLFPWSVIVILSRWRLHEKITLALKNMALVAFFSILISSYWIFIVLFTMVVSGSTIQPEYVLTNQMLDTFSSTASLSNVFRLMSSWWPQIELTPIVDSSVWTLLTFVIPIIFVSSLLFIRDRRLKFYAYSFAAIALMVMFFVKGTQPPISDFYPNLYDIPIIGWMFRVPGTSAMFLPFYMGMVIVFGLYTILKNSRKSIIIRFARIVIPLILVVSISIVSWPMFTGDFGGIYEDTRSGTTVERFGRDYNITISKNVVSVFGNTDRIATIQNSELVNTNETTILPADYNLDLFQSPSSIPSKIILEGQNSQIPLFHFLDADSIVIKPFDATREHNPSTLWSIAGTHDPLHGSFHDYLGIFGINNNDTDFGNGLVLTWGNDKLEIPVTIAKENSYHLFARYLDNDAGGRIKVTLNDNAVDVITKDESNQFIWQDLGIFDLSSGVHTLTLENVEGLNAVNMFVLIPTDSIPKINEKIQDIIDQSTLIYFLNNSDFTTKGQLVGETLITRQTGTFSNHITGQTITPSEASHFSLRLQALQHANRNSTYTIEELKVTPVQQDYLLSQDFEHLSHLQEWSVNRDRFISIMEESETPISGERSMKIDIIEGTSRVWEVVSTTRIPVIADVDVKYQFAIAAENNTSPHTKIIYYDGNNRIIKDDTIFRSPASTYQQNVERIVRTPTGTESLRLQFWMQPREASDSSLMVDDLMIEQMLSQRIFDNDFDLFRNMNSNSQHTALEANGIKISKEASDSPDWITIQTYPIPVKKDLQLNYDMMLNGENIMTLSAQILYYNITQLNYDDKILEDKGIVIPPAYTILADIDILKDSPHTIAFKAWTCPECGLLRVDLNGISEQVSLKSEVEQFQWFHLKTDFPEGLSHLNIMNLDSDEFAYVSNVIVYSSQESVNDLLGASHDEIAFEYERISPVKYVIRTDTEEPFMINFEGTPANLWFATVNGNEYTPLTLSPVMSGFYIYDASVSEITLEYKPHQWFILGSVVTITTLALISGYFIWQNRQASLFKGIIKSVDTVGIFEGIFNIFRIQNIRNIKSKINDRIEEIKRDYAHKDVSKPSHATIGATRRSFLALGSQLIGIFDFKPDFVIFLSILLLVLTPYLLIVRYSFTNEVTIAAYFLLSIGVLWKFVIHMKHDHAYQNTRSNDSAHTNEQASRNKT